MDYVKDPSSLLGKDFYGQKSIILQILYFIIFASFMKVCDIGVRVCTSGLHLIADDNPVSSDTSSIDNMLAEEGSMDTSSSNALKYVYFMYVIVVIWCRGICLVIYMYPSF